MAKGIVYLVGAGPGDPGLLTLRGRELLGSADCVVYDKLVDPQLLEWTRSDCERLYVGKQAGAAHHCTPQPEINRLLLEKANQGLRVVRLKGGDPLLFARGAEEAQVLAGAGIPFEIVPGVTAALGSAATAGIPLTHRDRASAVAFVTGHEDPTKENGVDWNALACFPGTLVVYMGLTRMPAIATELLERGKPSGTPVAFIEWGSTSRQQVVTTTLKAAATGSPEGLRSPVLAIVGPVVELRQQLEWFERRPLFGQRVLVVSPQDSAMRLRDQLCPLGAQVLLEPALAIRPLTDFATMDAMLARLADFSWIVFTSRPGVEHFLNRLLAKGRDLRHLGGIQIAAIGPGTAAALEAYHLRPDLVPQEYRAEALAEALAPRTAGKRVLLIRANRGREVLGNTLVERGAHVETVVAYFQADQKPADNGTLERLRAGEVDWVLFSSSNIARSFANWFGAEEKQDIFRRFKALSISPVTSEVMQGLGMEVAAEAQSYTLDGMVQALRNAVAENSNCRN